jgi:putative amide transporter protein
MVEPTLLAISLMWLPVALLFLGKGEAKGTGFVTALVGSLTIIGGIMQATIYKDPWIGALLVVYGFFYSSVAHALLTGQQDLRSVGNVSLTVAIISVVYVVFSITGGPVMENGEQLVSRSNFLAVAITGYALLYVMVWLNSFGSFSAKVLAYSLIVWTVVGLWIPGFWLLTSGKLPF